jgi:hypothetical protein
MKTLALAINVLLCISSFGQLKYEPGYIITNDGKNLSCLVKNMDWDNNPKEFYYRQDEASAPVKATINDVKEFAVGEAFKFRRLLASIDTSKNDLQNLENNKNPEYKNQLVFLRMLVEGKAILYTYKNEGQSWFFYGLSDSTVEPLVYKKYQSSETSFGENALYKSQLIQNFSCQELSARDLEDLKYNAKSLSKYFVDYNNCGNSPAVVYNRPASKGMFHLSLRPGVSFSSLDIEYTIPQANHTKFETKPTFRFGAEAEFVLPFNQNKWAIIIEPTYEYFKSDETGSSSEAYADYKAINIPFGIRYNMFLNSKAKLFINAGYGYAIQFNSTLVSKNGFKAKGGSGGNFFGGAGFSSGRLAVEARYYLPKNIMDQYNAWRADLQTISLVVGFRLI